MKKNKFSLIAMVIGILALIFQFGSIADLMGSSTSAAEEVGMGIGLLLVAPSVFSLVVAVILNIIGYLVSNRVVTLISAIFYAIALILMPAWGFVGIPSMILQFIAFSKMKKIKANQV
ncbi:MAG: hypothetical protein GX995_00925 [Clostridiales bacterium]|nr:hypothetical protein [Clostridiales bacterium]